MLKCSLSLHPDSRSPVESIEIAVLRDASGPLLLTYHLFGALNRVIFPPARPSLRTDELWKHSCVEAFLAAGSGYYELNFSPSSQWAAYRFDSYRTGMQDLRMPTPLVSWKLEGERAELAVRVELPLDVSGSLGLSAVIEDIEGKRSFWALAHSPGPPDFHNAACFAAELPPAG
ncbi:DOMON-like domain-containing protein [Sphingomonas crusticola]|uniref:DOMON-like domain-containing protein n=1 Tax=Sphingomonas crusticola TaxID=1697973 RepID=UPI001F07F750|nr:DOMON-like domain-containing protein [Sphingomonas crusticola]